MNCIGQDLHWEIQVEWEMVKSMHLHVGRILAVSSWFRLRTVFRVEWFCLICCSINFQAVCFLCLCCECSNLVQINSFCHQQSFFWGFQWTMERLYSFEYVVYWDHNNNWVQSWYWCWNQCKSGSSLDFQHAFRASRFESSDLGQFWSFILQ